MQEQLLNIDKIKIVDTIIDYYPELKKDRTHIINLVLERTQKTARFVFEKVVINNKTYYRDCDNILFTEDLVMAGLVLLNPDSTVNKIIIRRCGNRKEVYDKYIKELDEKAKNMFTKIKQQIQVKRKLPISQTQKKQLTSK